MDRKNRITDALSTTQKGQSFDAKQAAIDFQKQLDELNNKLNLHIVGFDEYKDALTQLVATNEITAALAVITDLSADTITAITLNVPNLNIESLTVQDIVALVSITAPQITGTNANITTVISNFLDTNSFTAGSGIVNSNLNAGSIVAPVGTITAVTSETSSAELSTLGTANITQANITQANIDGESVEVSVIQDLTATEIKADDAQIKKSTIEQLNLHNRTSQNIQVPVSSGTWKIKVLDYANNPNGMAIFTFTNNTTLEKSTLTFFISGGTAHKTVFCSQALESTIYCLSYSEYIEGLYIEIDNTAVTTLDTVWIGTALNDSPYDPEITADFPQTPLIWTHTNVTKDRVIFLGDNNAQTNGITVLGPVQSDFLQISGNIIAHDIWASGSLIVDGQSTFNSDVTFKGNIFQEGEGKIVFTEEIKSESDVIVLRDKNPLPLAEGEYSGIIVDNFNADGDNALFGIGSDGVFRVGEEGDTQALATRDDNPLDGGVMFWEEATHKLKSIDSIQAVDTVAALPENPIRNVLYIVRNVGLMYTIVDGVLDEVGAGNTWIGTKAEYDALPNTYADITYFITDKYLVITGGDNPKILVKGNIIYLTIAEYDAIIDAGTEDDNIMYVITDDDGEKTTDINDNDLDSTTSTLSASKIMAEIAGVAVIAPPVITRNSKQELDDYENPVNSENGWVIEVRKFQTDTNVVQINGLATNDTITCGNTYSNGSKFFSAGQAKIINVGLGQRFKNDSTVIQLTNASGNFVGSIRRKLGTTAKGSVTIFGSFREFSVAQDGVEFYPAIPVGSLIGNGSIRDAVEDFDGGVTYVIDGGDIAYTPIDVDLDSGTSTINQTGYNGTNIRVIGIDKDGTMHSGGGDGRYSLAYRGTQYVAGTDVTIMTGWGNETMRVFATTKKGDKIFAGTGGLFAIELYGVPFSASTLVFGVIGFAGEDVYRCEEQEDGSLHFFGKNGRVMYLAPNEIPDANTPVISIANMSASHIGASFVDTLNGIHIGGQGELTSFIPSGTKDLYLYDTEWRYVTTVPTTSEDGEAYTTINFNEQGERVVRPTGTDEYVVARRNTNQIIGNTTNGTPVLFEASISDMSNGAKVIESGTFEGCVLILTNGRWKGDMTLYINEISDPQIDFWMEMYNPTTSAWEAIHNTCRTYAKFRDDASLPIDYSGGGDLHFGDILRFVGWCTSGLIILQAVNKTHGTAHLTANAAVLTLSRRGANKA